MSDRNVRRKVAWGITGSGDKIRETFNTMKGLREEHGDVEVEVFLSKAGELVTRFKLTLENQIFENSFKFFCAQKVSNHSQALPIG